MSCIKVTVPVAELDLERVIFNNELSADIEVSKGTGLLLNYDLYGWVTPLPPLCPGVDPPVSVAFS